MLLLLLLLSVRVLLFVRVLSLLLLMLLLLSVMVILFVRVLSLLLLLLLPLRVVFLLSVRMVLLFMKAAAVVVFKSGGVVDAVVSVGTLAFELADLLRFVYDMMCRSKTLGQLPDDRKGMGSNTQKCSFSFLSKKQ